MVESQQQKEIKDTDVIRNTQTPNQQELKEKEFKIDEKMPGYNQESATKIEQKGGPKKEDSQISINKNGERDEDDHNFTDQNVKHGNKEPYRYDSRAYVSNPAQEGSSLVNGDPKLDAQQVPAKISNSVGNA